MVQGRENSASNRITPSVDNYDVPVTTPAYQLFQSPVEPTKSRRFTVEQDPTKTKTIIFILIVGLGMLVLGIGVTIYGFQSGIKDMLVIGPGSLVIAAILLIVDLIVGFRSLHIYAKQRRHKPLYSNEKTNEKSHQLSAEVPVSLITIPTEKDMYNTTEISSLTVAIPKTVGVPGNSAESETFSIPVSSFQESVAPMSLLGTSDATQESKPELRPASNLSPGPSQLYSDQPKKGNISEEILTVAMPGPVTSDLTDSNTQKTYSITVADVLCEQHEKRSSSLPPHNICSGYVTPSAIEVEREHSTSSLPID